jgi:hypothetical protein
MRIAIVLSVLLIANACFGGVMLDSMGTPLQQGAGRPEPFSHPGELLYEHECHVYNEEYDPDSGQYHYFQDFEGHLFEQIAGTIYWVSIQAVLVFPPQWGWCESADLWNDEGVVKSVYPFGLPDWTPLSEPLGYPVEFAFILYGADGLPKWEQHPLPGGASVSSQLDPYWIMDSECADDFLCMDGVPIAAIEWWGNYFNGGQVPPEYFIIRFYGDIPASPVEDASWSSIKAMYQ